MNFKETFVDNFDKNFVFTYSTRWSDYSHKLSQKCFIDLWQGSSCLEEFDIKVAKINDILFEEKKINIGTSQFFKYTEDDGTVKRWLRFKEVPVEEYPENSQHSGEYFYRPGISFNTQGYINRAAMYERKGVPMKKLQWLSDEDNIKKQKVTDWQELADYAEKLLDKR